MLGVTSRSYPFGGTHIACGETASTPNVVFGTLLQYLLFCIGEQKIYPQCCWRRPRGEASFTFLERFKLASASEDVFCGSAIVDHYTDGLEA